MVYTPTDIYNNVRPMLNDSGNQFWSDTRLREHLLKAYSDIITELQAVGVPSTDEETSAPITVAASAIPVVLTLPTDLIVPIELFERATGSSDAFIPLVRRAFLPDRTPEATLQDWAWVDQEIRLTGATQSNEVKLRYTKDLAALPADGDNIPILGCQAYLEYRSAALACVRGQNFDTAEVYNLEAKSELDKVLRLNVRNLQGVPVRRMPYRGIRKSWPWQ